MGIGSSIQRRRHAEDRAARRDSRAQIGRWSDARRAAGLMCTPAASMFRSLWTMIRSSAATGWRAWKLGPVGAMWNSGSSSLQAAGLGPPFVGVAHQHRRHLLRTRARSRRGSRASAACATGPTGRGACRRPAAACRRSAARPSPRRAARASAARAPRSRARRRGCFTRIALPCQPMLRVSTLSSRSVCLRALSNIALVADAEMHRLVHAVAVDQLVRHRRAAPAEALVGLLQRDDVGVDLLQHARARDAGRGGRRARPPCACCSWRR